MRRLLPHAVPWRRRVLPHEMPSAQMILTQSPRRRRRTRSDIHHREADPPLQALQRSGRSSTVPQRRIPRVQHDTNLRLKHHRRRGHEVSRMDCLAGDRTRPAPAQRQGPRARQKAEATALMQLHSRTRCRVQGTHPTHRGRILQISAWRSLRLVEEAIAHNRHPHWTNARCITEARSHNTNRRATSTHHPLDARERCPITRSNVQAATFERNLPRQTLTWHREEIWDPRVQRASAPPRRPFLQTWSGCGTRNDAPWN
mmetsp:Transcript_85342/g.245094  ORF Transcript_85342/g.245094 Transcript_85342/m.245094 type:complete len:258 (-) Transcript_85342:696-1469(-)